MLPVWLVDFLRVAKHQGLVNAAKLCSPNRPGGYITLRPRGCSHSLQLRRQYADREVFRQVFVYWIYRNPVAENPPPHNVVDAGAHIGLASIYFASRFPGSRILAVEPDANNFRMLVENTRPYPNITPVHAALWYQDAPISVEGTEEESWASRVNAEGRGQSVRGLTLKTLLASHGMETVDLLKVDVEGAEKEIFEYDPHVLDGVRVLYIELHDYMVPGSARAVYQLATKYNVCKYQNGELDILIFSQGGMPRC